MANAILEDERPPMWGIERLNSNPAAEILHFGRNRIPLSSIVSVTGEEEKTRPVDGLLIGAALFLVLATIIAFGVFEGQWLTRFLMGAGFLTFLGVVGLIELTKIKSQKLFRVRIGLASGETVTFASTDLDDVHRLMARISPRA